jgi:hypothetical protein
VCGTEHFLCDSETRSVVVLEQFLCGSGTRSVNDTAAVTV